ncbi:MAG: class I SAM-dependent methyltransferase [Verrucomicrobiae bacterium]|nr:class I SAM-dependent methyltransferase [Verrucomicrobiae bacterium]
MSILTVLIKIRMLSNTQRIYAKNLCKEYGERISFHNSNALRYRSKRAYDLIWSAGLFDYFDDKIFVFMLVRLREMLSQNGKIVIGNFSTQNPSKHYMELFDWHLYHRSPQSLRYLAKRAGFNPESIKVRKESLGVNLFLHIQPNASSVR